MVIVAPMKNVKMLPNLDAQEEEEATVVRGYVKKGIIKCILETGEGVNVQAIVIRGNTGMEKGRSAKYVCEDEKVKSGFDVVVWINGLQLQRHYAESVVNHVKHELQEKKKENDSGEGKGFFVVLDDFHNENHKEWLESVKKLKEVAETRASSGGGVFLVITRSKAVIEFVDQSFDFVHKYRFDRSSHSESRFLFEQIAGTSVSAIKSETKDSLLEMCGGILGAIETMERLEMLLKYYNEFNLSSWCLRRCFAYSFFIFSSQDSVKGEKLVRLWMVEGYLAHSSSSSSPHFQRGRIGRVMVTINNVYLKDEEIIDNYVGRVSLSSELDVSKVFTRLHVLILKNLGMKVLPGSIGDLKSLRYLDLSRNNFNKLPICIGELLHLQTLQLSHCLKLKELPDDVNYFASLRHLEVDECTNLMHMPSALRKLTWLRSLPHFVTSKRNSLGELIDLNEVRGELEISH
ncbi:putative disease resistance protein RGA3 [Glycine soja]|uniref:putative disease resistance protein RGA3 n=1 Tax=Glycine soja TaxID=3848 RepID=UPI0010392EE3|nr:putative disease resistance protein RGA3 [Glycine soja]